MAKKQKENGLDHNPLPMPPQVDKLVVQYLMTFSKSLTDQDHFGAFGEPSRKETV
jgi:hypothetical protein